MTPCAPSSGDGNPKAGTAPKESQGAPDLLNRDVIAARPNAVWVTHFMCIRTRSGFFNVAFAIAVFSRFGAGTAPTASDTDMVLTTLKMAPRRRDQAGTPAPERRVHHSDAGSQYTSIRSVEARF
jgi:putative transposase